MYSMTKDKPQLIQDRQLICEESGYVLLKVRLHVPREVLEQQEQTRHMPEGVLRSVKMLLKLCHIYIQQL